MNSCMEMVWMGCIFMKIWVVNVGCKWRFGCADGDCVYMGCVGVELIQVELQIDVTCLS